MNPVAVKALTWLGAAFLVLALIVLFAAITGIFPYTYVELDY